MNMTRSKGITSTLATSDTRMKAELEQAHALLDRYGIPRSNKRGDLSLEKRISLAMDCLDLLDGYRESLNAENREQVERDRQRLKRQGVFDLFDFRLNMRKRTIWNDGDDVFLLSPTDAAVLNAIFGFVLARGVIIRLAEGDYRVTECAENGDWIAKRVQP